MFTARGSQTLIEKSPLSAFPAWTEQKNRLVGKYDRFIAVHAIAGHKIVLIDDVTTTRTTAGAAASASADAGARSVTV